MVYADFQETEINQISKIRCCKKDKQMANNDGVANLPQDVIFEILTRLPPKAISRFRCVSKPWYHLLSHNEEFIARHLEWSKKNPVLLIRNYVVDQNGEVSKNKATIRLTSVYMDGKVADRFKIVVDGIVLRLISCGPITLLCCMSSIYVCNPSFHDTVRVPYCATNPLQNIGIGYDPSSRQYKIVHLFEELYTTETTMDCEVLAFRNSNSLSSASWRTRYGVCARSACTETSPLCLSGNIYWARSSGRNNRSILWFNLKEEEFSTLDYPSCDAESCYSFQEFTGIRGSLCVVGCSEETSRMDVWKLDMNEKTWIMEHSISLFPFAVNFLVSSDSQTEDLVIHTDREGLVCCDIKNRMSRRIKYFEGVRSYNKPCLYHYTLSPLHTDALKSSRTFVLKP